MESSSVRDARSGSSVYWPREVGGALCKGELNSNTVHVDECTNF